MLSKRMEVFSYQCFWIDCRAINHVPLGSLLMVGMFYRLSYRRREQSLFVCSLFLTAHLCL